jgi:hypothetical protein
MVAVEVDVFDIFTSYRSSDVRYGAAATYELLAARLGTERIFSDNHERPRGEIHAWPGPAEPTAPDAGPGKIGSRCGNF